MTRNSDAILDAMALSSPSGRMSKRARKAAQERLRVEVFGPNGLQRTEPKQPSKAESLRRHAQRLRDLADRGMSPRLFRKQAALLEQEADELEAAGQLPSDAERKRDEANR